MSVTALRNLQSEAAECGLACLAVAAQKAGSKIDLPWLRQHFPPSIRGMSVRQMADVAHAIGMTARAVRCEPDELAQLAMPAILHWNLNHFVVLTAVRAGKACVIDPAHGEGIKHGQNLDHRRAAASGNERRL